MQEVCLAFPVHTAKLMVRGFVFVVGPVVLAIGPKPLGFSRK